MNVKSQKSEVTQYTGGLFVDDRGELSFYNDCDLSKVKRMYTVSNHKEGFVRAWHGHDVEEKYITVTEGALLLAIVKIDDWSSPSKNLPIEKYVLSAKNPSIVHIPGGYAHGLMNLTVDTKIIVMSTASVEESKDDDYRFDARYWDPWKVEER